MTPSVSVIIPSYNRAYVLNRAIQSIFRQTYQDFEIIVVDDGSSDNTEEMIKGLNDPRVRYIRHETNRGAPAARNTGIKNSLGYFLSFLDSDDEWLPHKLELEINTLNENKDCVICSSGSVFIHERTGKVLFRISMKKQILTQEAVLKYYDHFNDNFTVIKKYAVSIGGYDESFLQLEDCDFWLRVTTVKRGICIPDYTAKIFVIRNDQISSGLKNKFEGTLLLSEKHKDLFLGNLAEYSKILFLMGLMCLLMSDNRALRYFQESRGFTTGKIDKIKTAIIIGVIKIFKDNGSRTLAGLYRLLNPNSYLLW